MAHLTQQDFDGFRAVMAHLLRVRRRLHVETPELGYDQDIEALEMTNEMAATAEDILRPHLRRGAA